MFEIFLPAMLKYLAELFKMGYLVNGNKKDEN